MKTKTTVVISLALILGAALVGVFLWNRLPDLMASHWNADDQVNGYLSKFWGVFFTPLVALGLLGLFLVIPKIDPQKANIAGFRETFNLFTLFLMAFLAYLHALTLIWNLGYAHFKISAAMLPLVGLLFMMLGLLLRKAKRNFFIGIRTPWTLSSDSVWDQTHQTGSILFMLSGALSCAGGFFGGATALWLTLAPLFGSTLFLVAYSYFLYRRETQAK
ncbi:MAG: SdpI family protein [Anaerolineales bacterium]|nr:SdpI family protein [Anaerolineales bacterium]